MTTPAAAWPSGTMALARSNMAVREVVRVVQGGAATTDGRPRDWHWLELGTATWSVVVPTQRSDWQSSGPEAEPWDTNTASTSATAFEPALLTPVDEAMAHMESAAAAGDERTFLAAKDAVDWEVRPAADFVRAVQLALSAGAHRAARNLATQGAARYPQNADLQQYARLLAPPRMLQNAVPPQPGLRANRDWLMTHGKQYRGQWVALRQGQLLGSADSLAALKKQIGDTANVLLTKAF